MLCPNEITRRNSCHTLPDLCALVLCFRRLCLQVRDSLDAVDQSSISSISSSLQENQAQIARLIGAADAS